MKRLLIVPVLALALSGCAGQSGSTTASVIAQIQATAQSICSFIPTAETIAAVLNQTGAAASIAIAEQICAAVVRRTGASRPTVHGVPIYGKFVSRR